MKRRRDKDKRKRGRKGGWVYKEEEFPHFFWFGFFWFLGWTVLVMDGSLV